MIISYRQTRGTAGGAEEGSLSSTLVLGELELGQSLSILALLNELVQGLDIGRNRSTLASLLRDLKDVHVLLRQSSGDSGLNSSGI
jgi:hypothetical protein